MIKLNSSIHKLVINMKKNILTFIIFFLSINCFSQNNNALYLYDSNVNIFSQENKNLGYIFITNSKDSKFKYDSFKFYIPTFKNFEERYNLSDLLFTKDKKEFHNYDFISVNSLKRKKGWEIHLYLSEYKNIYLVFESEIESEKYNLVQIFYEGTQKDLIPPPKGKI